jgi:hypothetical protein
MWLLILIGCLVGLSVTARVVSRTYYNEKLRFLRKTMGLAERDDDEKRRK